jgi:acid stress chaperone HdeB
MKMLRDAKVMCTWLVLLPLLLILSTAQAQTTVDAAKITCEEFILLRIATPDRIATWLDGYYHGKRGNTTIDVEQLRDEPQDITLYCVSNDKKATVMEAIEKLKASGK